MIQDQHEGWTPKIVGNQMIEALKWVRRTGPVGPAGIRSGQPAYVATADEYFEDFGLRESADEEEARSYPQPSPAQISRHLAALEWPLTYLLPHHEGSARTVGLWAACKANKRPFDAAVRERGISRSFAYALRDRGLSIISQGLERDGVQP